MRRSARKRLGRRLGAVTVGLTVFGMVVSTTATHAAEPTRQTPLPGVLQTNSPTMIANDDLARIVSASGGSVLAPLTPGKRVHAAAQEAAKPVVRDVERAMRP